MWQLTAWMASRPFPTTAGPIRLYISIYMSIWLVPTSRCWIIIYSINCLPPSSVPCIYIRTPRSTNSQSNTPSQGDDDIYYYSYATSIVLLDLIIHSSAGQKPVFITCMHILYYVYIPLYVPVATCCWYHLAFTHRSPCCICFLFFWRERNTVSYLRCSIGPALHTSWHAMQLQKHTYCSVTHPLHFFFVWI